MTGAPLAVTCGDPAGIGPEVAAKAWAELGDALPFLWIGDPRTLPGDTPHVIVERACDAAAAAARGVPVLPLTMPAAVHPGRPEAANARCVVRAIDTAIALARSGAARGIVTGPIAKSVLIDGADFGHPGHTEYLAAACGVDRVAMLLACPALRVVPATIHIPLSDVPARLTTDLLLQTVRLLHTALRRDFGIAAPRIALTGLNPHAGESGKMGHEEVRVIAPAIAELVAEGMDVRGPFPADTLFHAQARRGYDAAVAMYHDQALIPIKTIDFAGGVNVTLGLPFIRTSPDHGTAFDIAGRGVADPTSMIAALRCADAMARARSKA